MRRFLPGLIVLLLLGLPLASLAAGSWQLFNTGTGLPNNRVLCFAAGKGKMAVGTAAGLAEYSGETCLWRPIGLPENIASCPIRDLAYDEKGNLWFATFGGVGVRQEGHIEMHAVPEGLPTVDIERLQIKGNEIFVGSHGGYISKAFIPHAGRTSFTPVNYSTLLDDEKLKLRSVAVSGLAMKNSAQGWFSTRGVGLIEVSGMNEIVYDRSKGLPDEWVEGFWIFPGPQKAEHMLVASIRGIGLFRDGNHLGNVEVPMTSSDPWITTLVAAYSETYPEPPRKGVNNEWSLHMFLGKRSLWVGTKHDGLLRYELGKWTQYLPDNSMLPSRSINRVYVHKNRVIVCTDEGLAIVPLGGLGYDEFKHTGIGARNFKTIYPNLTMCPVWSMDKRNDFWVATGDGLCRFIGVSGGSADLMEDGGNLSGSAEETNPAARDGDFYRPITLGGELKWHQYYQENGTLFSNLISSMVTDTDNQLWVVFKGKIFARLRIDRFPGTGQDQDQLVERLNWDFIKARNLPWPGDTPLCCLWFDQGKLYVGTKGQGFYVLTNPGVRPDARGDYTFEWQHFGMADGLYYEHVIGFARQDLADGSSRIVLLHPERVTLWEAQGFRSLDNDTRRNYTCLATDRLGNLWLGSRNGLLRITPEGKYLTYTGGNAFFESNEIIAVLAAKDLSGTGISLWVSCDQTGGSDKPPTIKVINGKKHTLEPDIDGASVHYYDGLTWDKYKIAGIGTFLLDGDFLWLGSNIRLRRIAKFVFTGN